LLRFDHWRLVVRRGGADGGTVEVAHEALFREWKRLQGWLEPERVRLEDLRSLQVDAATWDRNGRAATFLNHRDKRLAETAALAAIEGYRKRMAAVDLDYLSACQAAERSARRRLRTAQTMIGVLILGIIGGMATSIWHDDLQQGWRYLTVTRRAHQAVDDLELALLAVPIVTEPGEFAAAPLQVARRHVVEHQRAVISAVSMWFMPRSRPRRNAATAARHSARSICQVPCPITATCGGTSSTWPPRNRAARTIKFTGSTRMVPPTAPRALTGPLKLGTLHKVSQRVP
jgi:hypothetical protein